ncbi:hypothetical protein Krac_4353 [Ktedonobacter racemifer DSM 44963]|uniref:Uncharacterized protein n=1 Tax=Ktedonobacter racemifer DSM 44963 TaxID=485913 RepID=D6TSJ6_KTERA|nr:hypothetical protein Krac_4353 [Ktedonobacter racemifer DSM 44963]
MCAWGIVMIRFNLKSSQPLVIQVNLRHTPYLYLVSGCV